MTVREMYEYCRDRVGLDNCTWSQHDPKRPAHWYPPDYFLQVPCGKCSECLKRRRQEWVCRLCFECDQWPENSFVSLTLDNEYLDRFKDDPKRPLKLYIDRLRKKLGKRPKYFFVPELGDENGRLHYHGIIFNTSRESLSFDVQRDTWKYGIVYIGYVNEKTAPYITKYMLKGSQDLNQFIMCSNGIGAGYVNEQTIEKHVNDFDCKEYVKRFDTYYPLPRYYSDKLFSEDVKLVKMLNRHSVPQDTWYLRGKTFTDYCQYIEARNSLYDLLKDLHKPEIKKPNLLNLQPDGKFCVPQGGFEIPEPF